MIVTTSVTDTISSPVEDGAPVKEGEVAPEDVGDEFPLPEAGKELLLTGFGAPNDRETLGNEPLEEPEDTTVAEPEGAVPVGTVWGAVPVLME